MSVTEAIEKIDESFHKQENIFLFVPNLIGMLDVDFPHILLT